MATKEIKQKIELDGEKEYNAAIREAQRNLRTLRSELKAETAELGANATAQQKNEARSKSLQKQIAEQEKVVKTLKDALAEAKKDYGDNENVVAKWETKLNEARATLGNMKNELDGLGQAYEGVNESTEMGIVATKSFADSVASIASVGDSVSSAIEDIFTGLIDRVSDVVVELWDLIGDTAAKADNYVDIAGFWNTDPAKIQQWDNALRASGKDLESFQQIVTRLNLGGKSKEITEMLGVSDANYEDEWSYAIAVMDRISELQSKGELADNFWETIFGEKKSLNAKDIIDSWDSITGKLAEYDADNGGFGLNSEEIDQMSSLFEQLKEAETRLDAIKDKIAAGFGELTASLMFNVNGGLEAINDILNAETEAEREEAVQKLEQNVSELFNKVADAIRAGIEILGDVGEELSTSDDPIVSAIGKIMKDIADALEWMVNHSDEVKIALEAIFGAWLVGRLTSIAGQLTAIVAQINLIKAFSAEKALADVAGAAGNGAGAASAAGAAGGGASIGIGAGVAALAGLGFLFSKGVQYRQQYGQRGSVEAIEKGAEGNDDLQEAFTEFIDSQAALEEAMMNVGTVSDEEADRLAAQADEASKRLYSFDEAGNLMHLYSDWRQENGYGNMDWVMPDNMFGMTPGTIVDDTLDSDVKSMESTVGVKLDDIKDAVVRSARENARAYAGMTVTLDGAVVGRLITPYVSGGIARNVMVDR